MGTYLACAFELSPWLKRGACAARLVMQNQLSETSEGGKSGALPRLQSSKCPASQTLLVYVYFCSVNNGSTRWINTLV